MSLCLYSLTIAEPHALQAVIQGFCQFAPHVSAYHTCTHPHPIRILDAQWVATSGPQLCCIAQSETLGEFWSKRWNCTVSSLLRMMVGAGRLDLGGGATSD